MQNGSIEKLQEKIEIDSMIHGLYHNQKLRIAICRVSETLKKAQKLHELDPLATIALGRALASCAVMGSTLKEDDAYIQCLFKGDGPMGGLISEYIAPGSLRGFVFHPQISQNLADRQEVPETIGEALGHEGTLSVKIGRKNETAPYTAITNLFNGEIAEDIANYYLESAQLPSILAAGVKLSAEGEVISAGAILIQKIGGEEDLDEEILGHYETKLSEDLHLSDRLATKTTLQEILSDICLVDDAASHTETESLGFNCFCGRERMAMALISLGKRELEEIRKDTGKLETTCHFCSETYRFQLDELVKNDSSS